MESVYPSLTSLKKLFVFLRKLSTAMLGDEDKMFRLSQKGLCSTICYASMVILMLTRLEKSNICMATQSQIKAISLFLVKILLFTSFSYYINTTK